MESSHAEPGDPRAFRVKFLDGCPDVILLKSNSETVGSVARELRQRKGWSETSHVRLIAGGKELFQEDLLGAVGGNILHCVVSERKAGVEGSPLKADRSHIDWFDVVDPSAVLMWVFGMMLGLFWILFFCRGELFDNASVAMLVIMTLAFIIPCAANHWHWPSSWQAVSSEHTSDVSTGYSSSISYGALRLRQSDVACTPPRPHAQFK